MADVEVPTRHGMNLLDYLLDDVKRIVLRRRVLLASEPGTGKTVVIAGVCNAVQARRILIISPAAILQNWDRELRKWIVGDVTD